MVKLRHSQHCHVTRKSKITDIASGLAIFYTCPVALSYRAEEAELRFRMEELEALENTFADWEGGPGASLPPLPAEYQNWRTGPASSDNIPRPRSVLLPGINPVCYITSCRFPFAYQHAVMVAPALTHTFVGPRLNNSGCCITAPKAVYVSYLFIEVSGSAYSTLHVTSQMKPLHCRAPEARGRRRGWGPESLAEAMMGMLGEDAMLGSAEGRLPHPPSHIASHLSAMRAAFAGMSSGRLPPHLLFSDRDFNEDDYEALLALDETVENRKGELFFILAAAHVSACASALHSRHCGACHSVVKTCTAAHLTQLTPGHVSVSAVCCCIECLVWISLSIGWLAFTCCYVCRCQQGYDRGHSYCAGATWWVDGGRRQKVSHLPGGLCIRSHIASSALQSPVSQALPRQVA